MARPLRIEYPGAVYHIYARGNAKQNIFLNSEDRRKFLKILEQTITRTEWICHSYVLMDNHYHLLIETPKANLSKGMKHLNGVYSQSFNIKHNRVGHLFQERFKSLVIEKDSYLLSLCGYILRNPVKAKIVKKVEDYKWSSYRSIIGKVDCPHFLNRDWILNHFSNNRRNAIKQFENFVSQGIDMKFPVNEVSGKLILGSTKFISKIKKLSPDSAKILNPEIPKEQKYIHRKELDEIFLIGVKSGKSRDEIIYIAYFQYDYYMREIAEYLKIHYATVSRAIKKIEETKEMS